MFRLTSCLTVLVFLLTTAAPITQAASFQGLGDLPGGNYYSLAFAVSADGSTVVGRSSSTSATSEAFRWTSGTGMVGLGDLPGGDVFSTGDAISADGSTIVGASVSGSGEEAFRWTASTGMVGLGDLPGGIFNSHATAVSADGSTIAGVSNSAPIFNGSSSGFDDSLKRWEAFRWTASGMVGLGDLPGGEVFSRAYGISADGSTVVGESMSGSGAETFRWTAGGGMVGLGDLPGAGFNSDATAVSADGSTIVGMSFSAAGWEAFRWTAGTGMVGLGDLPGGHYSSQARAVSADGSTVVGRGDDSGPTWQAFIWNPVSGMRNLQDLLVSDLDLDLTGWTLTEATGISDDGLTIVGHGYNSSGFREGWTATIPEPTTLLLTLLALAAVPLRMRSRTFRS